MIGSVPELKKILGIKPEDVSQDFRLGLYLSSAGDMIEQYLGRKFERAQYRETVSGLGYGELTPMHYPILSIEELYSSSDRSFSQISLLNFGDYGIGDEGTSIVSYRGNFERGTGNIQYVYTAGYEEIPPSILMAVYWLAEWFYKMNQSGNVGRASAGKQGESFSILQDIPPFILSSIQGYKRFEVPGYVLTSVRIGA